MERVKGIEPSWSWWVNLLERIGVGLNLLYRVGLNFWIEFPNMSPTYTLPEVSTAMS